MIRTNIFNETQAHKIVSKKGYFAVLEYTKDLSVKREEATMAYYLSKMNVRKRQLIARLNAEDDNAVILQAGAMQLMMGDVEVSTNVSGLPELVKNTFSSRVTKETIIKPLYYGDGLVLLEPTERFILLEDLEEWRGTMVIQDRMFLACDETVGMRVTHRKNLSSALLGREGIFNTELFGNGIVALESPAPEEELIIVDMEDDIIRIDGDMAIAWSGTLEFTVEKITDTLVGSFMTGEKLVNVYKGTGRLMVAPVMRDVRKELRKGDKGASEEKGDKEKK